RVDAAERDDAGDSPARADDDLPADLLAQDPVRGADVVATFRRDRRRLEAEARLADRGGRLVDDRVSRRPPGLEREVEPAQLELEADDIRREHPQRLLEE